MIQCLLVHLDDLLAIPDPRDNILRRHQALLPTAQPSQINLGEPLLNQGIGELPQPWHLLLQPRNCDLDTTPPLQHHLSNLFVLLPGRLARSARTLRSLAAPQWVRLELGDAMRDSCVRECGLAIAFDDESRNLCRPESMVNVRFHLSDLEGAELGHRICEHTTEKRQRSWTQQRHQEPKLEPESCNRGAVTLPPSLTPPSPSPANHRCPIMFFLLGFSFSPVIMHLRVSKHPCVNELLDIMLLPMPALPKKHALALRNLKRAREREREREREPAGGGLANCSLPTCYPLSMCYSSSIWCASSNCHVLPTCYSACVRVRVCVCAAPRKAKSWPNATPALHCAHRRGASF